MSFQISRNRPTQRQARVHRDRFGLGKIGASRFDFRDPYHLAVSLSWPAFILSVIAVWVALNVIFAILYLLIPDGVTNARPGSFADVFFFSVETLATVGYGVMAPSTLYAHIVSSLEIVTGMAFTAIVTGLLFVRFSRAKAKILFADDAVVSTYNNQPALMLRLVNARLTAMTSATARAYVLIGEQTLEGSYYRRIYELPLLQSHLPLFIMPWTVIHPIDQASPLSGLTAEALSSSDIRIFVTLEARDHALSDQVQAIKDYAKDHIRFGMRFADSVTLDEDGQATADLRRISLLEPDTNPPWR